MKYIFMAGAPGSKWSSVSKNIYYSPGIDNSDYSNERTYYHDASGKMDLMHMGAYFDPGMEFGSFFDEIKNYTKDKCESEFDRPFRGRGVRIIKSHVFANNLDFLKSYWPECPIILVHRGDDACLGWWVKCGHFNITYPSYKQYYKDLPTMAKIIAEQNKDIVSAMLKTKTRHPLTNLDLCKMLNIQAPPKEYFQDYGQADIKVTVI